MLDNFEHLVDAAPLAGELLAAAPQLSILATSRERLHVYGEQEYPVEPLSIPDLRQSGPSSRLVETESVDLFIRRARAAKPNLSLTEDDLQAIARTCVRLDGLPLAIELAASQIKVQSPASLAKRLEAGLGALPPAHAARDHRVELCTAR